MPSPDPEKLESLIHRTLRALPDREAPRTLEARVTAAVSRHAALPWWRRPCVHWPAGLRYAFILLLAVAAAAVFAFGRSDVTGQAIGELALRFPWIAFLQSVGASLMETAGTVFDDIPSVWLYGAVALLAVSYALLLGLGAATYRLCFHPRRLLRPISS